jgi:hypothetical protein
MNECLYLCRKKDVGGQYNITLETSKFKCKMKGKKEFTTSQIEKIKQLISEKVWATPDK